MWPTMEKTQNSQHSGSAPEEQALRSLPPGPLKLLNLPVEWLTKIMLYVSTSSTPAVSSHTNTQHHSRCRERTFLNYKAACPNNSLHWLRLDCTQSSTFARPLLIRKASIPQTPGSFMPCIRSLRATTTMHSTSNTLRWACHKTKGRILSWWPAYSGAQSQKPARHSTLIWCYC